MARILVGFLLLIPLCLSSSHHQLRLMILQGDTYIALVPLWAYTPVEMSGLGWTPPYIAGIIALAGIFQPFWLLLIMPILDKRMGTQKLTRACFAVWPAFLAAPILANQVARRGWWDAVYAVMAMTQFTGAGISMVFSEWCWILA